MKKIEAFWDTNALVPLCIEQGKSRLARLALRQRSIAVWWSTPVEMVSALARLLRQKDIDQRDFGFALMRMSSLRRSWIEILPNERVRESAEDLLRRHPLRAADAMQLAAALVWSRGYPQKRLFISADGALAESAALEGFRAERI